MPGASRIPGTGASRAKPPASSTSKMAAPGSSRASKKPASASKLQAPGGSKIAKPKTESKLKKFDRTVNEELRRRKDAGNVLVGATTSDVNVQKAVAHLAKAETANLFAGAVHAAEMAAANVDPTKAEEAAAEGARSFQVCENYKKYFSIHSLLIISINSTIGTFFL